MCAMCIPRYTLWYYSVYKLFPINFVFPCWISHSGNLSPTSKFIKTCLFTTFYNVQNTIDRE